MRHEVLTSDSLRSNNYVRPLTESDAPMVKELAEVLKKYDALDRFGLTLLHQHLMITIGTLHQDVA